jgi:integrase/recombinase XerD
MAGLSRVRVSGPLESYARGFAVELSRQGYTANSAALQLRLMAHVSRWLASEKLDVAGLTPGAVERFLVARRVAGYVDYLSPKALVPLLGYLRGLGVAPPAGPGVVAVGAVEVFA